MTRLVLAATMAAMSSVASAQTLRYATTDDIFGLDPHGTAHSASNVFHQSIYEPLVRYSSELKIEPSLAVSWEILQPNVVRYRLREGVKFHDGSAFGADDVAMSLKRATTGQSPLRGNLPSLVKVEVIDDHTVDLHLTGPTPLLNNYLTNFGIMDADWLTAHNAVEPVDAMKGEEGYATSNANGTGPFKVESRRPDAETVLVVNEGWWDKPQHNLTRIVYTPIKSDATRVAALLSGQVDIIQPAPLQDQARIASSPGVKMLEAPGLRTIMMGINQREKLFDGDVDKNPFADPRVRKAAYQAINIELLRDKIMRGKSRNAGMLIAPEIPGFEEKQNVRFPYDVEAAKAALAEAGYPNGFQFGMNCTNDDYVNDEEICQALAAMFTQAGFKPKLTTESKSIYYNRVLNQETDMFILGWATLPMLDGFSVLSAMLHSPSADGSYGTWNPGGYTNAKVDELVKKIEVELDEVKRVEMMKEAFAIAREEIAWLPLHQQPMSWATRDNVEVIQMPDDLLRLWLVRVN
jgi:peptide/nickel transport system substrate-binding protein